MPKTCILICTYNRPELLRRLLTALVPQARKHGCMTVIVDNGTRSSEAVASSFHQEMEIIYERLSEPGLVSARNRAMRLALASHPEFLACIDDDEVPEADWLANLLQRIEETGAGFATGPVVPEFAVAPPRWATDGAYFFAEGDSFRTSNLILRAAILPKDESQWFHPAFNYSGGEDSEFLGRLAANGAVHVVAENAVVRESVPASRLKRRYIWRRGLRDGVAIAQILALRSKSRTGFAARIMGRAGAKFGYAANHLFWSPLSPWQFHRAMADLAAATGILLRAVGVKFAFYGRPGQHANYRAAPDNEMR
ncbi:MAG TPA: glycosyltransferase family 2 protein [Aestuariivirga sp.]|nr:glycosyltransferase family 2 protein [Aestuariivirga sp.]